MVQEIKTKNQNFIGKYSMIDLILAVSILSPNFIRVGPIAIYQGLIAFAFLLLLASNFQTVFRFQTRWTWMIRCALLAVCFLYYSDLRALIVYLICPVMLCLLVYMYAKDIPTIDRIINVILACSAINFVICLIECVTEINVSYLLSTDATQYEPLYRAGILRVAGAFVNAINNGVFCMFVAVLCLYKIMQNREKGLQSLSLWLLFLVNCITILLTYSRAVTLITIILVLLLLYRVRLIRVNLGSIVFLLVILCGILLLSVSQTFSERVTEMFLPFFQIFDDLFGSNFVSQIGDVQEVEGIGDRLRLYEWVVAKTDNTVFGQGKDAAFSYVASEYGHLKESIENQYLYEFYHYGILGLIGKILLYLGELFYCVKWVRTETKNGVRLGFNYMMLLLVIAYIILQFTVAQNEERKVFYILMALQMAVNRQSVRIEKGV